MVFSFRQGCGCLEDNPTCGKPLTTQNPRSLKIHELMARGQQMTTKLIKYQLHINQEMICQILGGSGKINICNASVLLSHA
jgi:DNA-binding CsgD family transcriptional regulator